MAISVGAAASSIYLEGIGCSTSYDISSSWLRPHTEIPKIFDHSGTRCMNPFFGSTQYSWLQLGRDICISKISVAADYSDSVPDSSSYAGNRGYHPLEELKDRKRSRKTKLTSAEITKTTVEANSSALLLFPGTVHSEPHEDISWERFQYVIDEYGDIFLKIYDDENILQDRGASNPVNALIGMDTPLSMIRRLAGAELKNFEGGLVDGVPFDDYYFEVEDSEIFEGWGVPDSFDWVHPIYFSKCLTKAVNMEYAKNMDHPSNGVSILGWLRPAFIDEELYLRRLFNGEETDGYNSDWEDEKLLGLNAKDDGCPLKSTIYKLEIVRMELASVYGVQSAINLQEFREAEADVLVHSIPAIIERFSKSGTKFALTALCKKKGLQVQGANLIGVDSLGIDVRVTAGTEVWTHRFPFKVRATSEAAAEKQIQQLLFPRAHRKKVGSHADELGNLRLH